MNRLSKLEPLSCRAWRCEAVRLELTMGRGSHERPEERPEVAAKARRVGDAVAQSGRSGEVAWAVLRPSREPAEVRRGRCRASRTKLDGHTMSYWMLC